MSRNDEKTSNSDLYTDTTETGPPVNSEVTCTWPTVMMDKFTVSVSSPCPEEFAQSVECPDGEQHAVEEGGLNKEPESAEEPCSNPLLNFTRLLPANSPNVTNEECETRQDSPSAACLSQTEMHDQEDPHVDSIEVPRKDVACLPSNISCISIEHIDSSEMHIDERKLHHAEDDLISSSTPSYEGPKTKSSFESEGLVQENSTNLAAQYENKHIFQMDSTDHIYEISNCKNDEQLSHALISHSPEEQPDKLTSLPQIADSYHLSRQEWHDIKTVMDQPDISKNMLESANLCVTSESLAPYSHSTDPSDDGYADNTLSNPPSVSETTLSVPSVPQQLDHTMEYQDVPSTGSGLHIEQNVEFTDGYVLGQKRSTQSAVSVEATHLQSHSGQQYVNQEFPMDNCLDGKMNLYLTNCDGNTMQTAPLVESGALGDAMMQSGIACQGTSSHAVYDTQMSMYPPDGFYGSNLPVASKGQDTCMYMPTSSMAQQEPYRENQLVNSVPATDYKSVTHPSASYSDGSYVPSFNSSANCSLSGGFYVNVTDTRRTVPLYSAYKDEPKTAERAMNSYSNCSAQIPVGISQPSISVLSGWNAKTRGTSTVFGGSSFATSNPCSYSQPTDSVAYSNPSYTLEQNFQPQPTLMSGVATAPSTLSQTYSQLSSLLAGPPEGTSVSWSAGDTLQSTMNDGASCSSSTSYMSPGTNSSSPVYEQNVQDQKPRSMLRHYLTTRNPPDSGPQTKNDPQQGSNAIREPPNQAPIINQVYPPIDREKIFSVPLPARIQKLTQTFDIKLKQGRPNEKLQGLHLFYGGRAFDIESRRRQTLCSTPPLLPVLQTINMHFDQEHICLIEYVERQIATITEYEVFYDANAPRFPVPQNVPIEDVSGPHAMDGKPIQAFPACRADGVNIQVNKNMATGKLTAESGTYRPGFYKETTNCHDVPPQYFTQIPESNNSYPAPHGRKNSNSESVLFKASTDDKENTPKVYSSKTTPDKTLKKLKRFLPQGIKPLNTEGIVCKSSAGSTNLPITGSKIPARTPLAPFQAYGIPASGYMPPISHYGPGIPPPLLPRPPIRMSTPLIGQPQTERPPVYRHPPVPPLFQQNPPMGQVPSSSQTFVRPALIGQPQLSNPGGTQFGSIQSVPQTYSNPVNACSNLSNYICDYTTSASATDVTQISAACPTFQPRGPPTMVPNLQNPLSVKQNFKQYCPPPTNLVLGNSMLKEDHLHNLDEHSPRRPKRPSKQKQQMEYESRRHVTLNPLAVKIMQTWYERNVAHPYPSLETAEVIAEKGNISVEQVKKWFANKRLRNKNTKSLSAIAAMRKNARKKEMNKSVSTEEQQTDAS